MHFESLAKDCLTLEEHDVDKRFGLRISEMGQGIRKFGEAVKSAKDFASSIVGPGRDTKLNDSKLSDRSKLSVEWKKVLDTGRTAKSAISLLGMQPSFNVAPCSEVFTNYENDINDGMKQAQSQLDAMDQSRLAEQALSRAPPTDQAPSHQDPSTNNAPSISQAPITELTPSANQTPSDTQAPVSYANNA